MNMYKSTKYNNMFPCTDENLRGALSDMEQKTNLFASEEDQSSLISHSGFNSIQDVNAAIETTKDEISTIKTILYGTENTQGMLDRINELEAEIEKTKTQLAGLTDEIVNNYCHKMIMEYEDLLKQKTSYMTKLDYLNQSLEKLMEAKKTWKNHKRETYLEVVKYFKKLLEQLKSAKNELKELEKKDNKTKLEIQRIEELKETIASIEKNIPEELIDKKRVAKTSEKKETTKSVTTNAEKEITKPVIKNVKIRKDVLAKFRGMAQICNQEEPSSFANIGNVLYASSNIGLVRENNEDSYAICTHPELGDFSISLVADGMGGHKNGEVASNYVANELIEWFKSLPTWLYYDPIETKNIIEQKVKELNSNIPAGGTTLACMIACEKDSVITTVGDSRVYALTSDGLKQIGEDHSEARLNGIDNETARFYTNNNIITSCLGKGRFKISQSIIPRMSYISLHAMTDGITDLISEKKLEKILLSDKTPAEKHEEIINLANNPKNRDLVRLKYLFKNDYRILLREGKDNQSIVSNYNGYTVRR